MFDAAFDFEDFAAADTNLGHLDDAVRRAADAGRFLPDTHPRDVAVQTWAIAHGLVSLVIGGPLPRRKLDDCVPMLTALFVSAGDRPDECRASVEKGWSAQPPRTGAGSAGTAGE